MKKPQRNFLKRLHLLRFNTTFRAHHWATGFSWYKRWHDFKFSSHFHAATLVTFVGCLIFSLVASLFMPSGNNKAFAANGSWTQTTDTQFNAGTYGASTQLTGTGDTSVSLKNGLNNFSNPGGGIWPYKKTITIDNAANGTNLSEHQVLIDSERDLVLDWHLDEGVGATANNSTSAVINGTNYGSSYWSATNKYGGASFSCNANNYTQVANGGGLSSLTKITTSVWVKLSSGSGTQTIVNKYDNAPYAGYALSANMNTANNLAMWVGSGSWVTVNYTWDTNWHYVTGTYDGTNVRLYVDGNLIGSPSPQAASLNSTSAFRTCRQSTGGYPLSGLVDEVKVYSRDLSQSEIQAAMNNVNAGFFSGNMKSDGSDIRFTDTNGSELSYYQERFSNTTTGRYYKYYVKVPTVTQDEDLPLGVESITQLVDEQVF